jgi:hypothetical protein
MIQPFATKAIPGNHDHFKQNHKKYQTNFISGGAQFGWSRVHGSSSNLRNGLLSSCKYAKKFWDNLPDANITPDEQGGGISTR